jgi:hypothetical protein
MKRSVAKQDQILSAYERSPHKNFSTAEAMKDKRIEQLTSLNE